MAVETWSVAAKVICMVTMRFPVPENDNDFDALVSQIAEKNYGNTASRYGRNGQAQHGVDITLRGARGELIAIQSKHTAALTVANMDEEIDKLLGRNGKGPGFAHVVAEFIFATSAARDTKQTNHTLKLEALHAPLRVSVWPWDRINEMLNTMPVVAGQYVAAVLGDVPVEEAQQRHVTVLRQVLDRRALLDGFALEFSFRDQLSALQTMSGFFSTGNQYDANGVLVDSALLYKGEDSYGRDLVALKKSLCALIRYIEAHIERLEGYRLSGNGRQLDAGTIDDIKIYVDYEAKRLAVIKKANTLLTKEGLASLPL